MILVHSIHQMLYRLDGGTTRPWLALVDDGSELPSAYVVKLFSAHDLSQANYAAAEIMGSVLCNAFNVLTPEYCLATFSANAPVNCPQAFVERMNEKRYPQPWFASRSIAALEASHALRLNNLSMDESVNLFAFDCLILNTDRNNRKPNLLVNDEGVFAIDHERAFGFHNPTTNSLGFVAKQHLCFNRVKKHYRKHGNAIFAEFQYNLSKLNLAEWSAALNQLEQMDMQFVHRAAWQEYLLTNKASNTQFISLLCRLLK